MGQLLGRGAMAVALFGMSLPMQGEFASGQTDPAQSRGVMVLRASPATNTPDTPPAPPPPPPPPPIPAAPLARFKPCPRPFAPSEIAVTDAFPANARFDAALRGKLSRHQPSVVVDLATPFEIGTVPPELAPWLTQVKSTQGNVTVPEYCRESRGLFGFLNKMFNGPRAGKYSAADGYDAVLHANGLDRMVTQVEFRLRTAP